MCKFLRGYERRACRLSLHDNFCSLVLLLGFWNLGEGKTCAGDTAIRPVVNEGALGYN